jgi:hypothetical protein
MSDKKDWSRFDLGTPAIYRIKIRGFLEKSWSNQLGGIVIRHIDAADPTPNTTLQGEMVDQAALFGVLNTLYGLGFPILSVECLSEEEKGDGPQPAPEPSNII